jgi:hypothetical protein
MKMEYDLNFLSKTRLNSKSDQFSHLIQVIKDDDEINNRVVQLLKLDSYQRRNVLNRWLEQLRRENASKELRTSLSCLFDDDIAIKVLTIINNSQF